MIKKQNTMKFFRFRNGWYADVKGKSLGSNQMVAGADVFLESLSCGKQVIVADVRTTWTHHALYKFVLTHHDNAGGTYDVFKLKRDRAVKIGTAWLCNVTHVAMGEHADRFYVKSFKLADMNKKESDRLSARYGMKITSEKENQSRKYRV